MNYKNLLFAILSLLAINVFAQSPVYENYKWDDSYQIPDSVSAEKVILKKTEIVEFIFEGDYFLEYQLNHMVELINSDEQIQQNNKKYLPFSASSEIVDARIRVIKPNKEIMELDESKILTAIDDDTGEYHKYFALEGLEIGSVIDYYYVLKKYPSYSGTRTFIQDEYLTQEYNFELFCPSHFEFLFKVYNDTIRVVEDSTMFDKKHYILTMNSIEGLEYEESSPYGTLLKQLVYKLDKNNANHAKDLTSLGSASTKVYNNVFSEPDKQDQKALSSLLKDIKIADKDSREQKIIAIENYVKDNINLVDDSDPTYSKIASAVKMKLATEMGMIRLFLNLYRMSEIDIQVVLTCDRTKFIFDKEFESYHYLINYLIYFPETKKYIVPTAFEYRYDLLPWELTANSGLFIKETTLGEYRTGIGKVKYIEPQDYNSSYHNIHAQVILNNAMNEAVTEMKISSFGQYAVSIQPYYSLFNAETQDEFMKDYFETYLSESEVSEWSVEKGEAQYVGKEPFIQTYKTTTSELIDLAGKNYLFKIGMLIGRQVELYSESERSLVYDDRYKRSFNRTLIVEFPKGYKVKNPDDLIFNVECIEDGKTEAIFKSDYTIENNKITVNIEEYYDEIRFDIEDYESYRKVVNSAADFEKVVLVLEKE